MRFKMLQMIPGMQGMQGMQVPMWRERQLAQQPVPRPVRLQGA
jgi:hypothetical protein